MPKVSAPLKGIFKEMLDDYLKVVAKEGGQAAAKEGGQAAGKEAAQAAVKAADEVVEVPFKLSKQMSKYKDEMVRQLDRQLKHFDGKTPREIIDALENPVKRTGKAQKEARERFTQDMLRRQNEVVRKMDPDDIAKQMKDFGLDPSGNKFKDAKALAEARTDGFMKTVAALHEPDIVAGGKDVIGKHANGVDSFGLSNVNSSIGSQWRSLKNDLIEQLKGMNPDTPIRMTHPL